MPTPKKSLGQHWLHDRSTLVEMCDAIDLCKEDTVLEIGPGLGTLTQQIAKRAKQVVAVEFDKDLADNLHRRVQAQNVTVIHHDILTFDLTDLPVGYKVAANVPYYITSKIVELLLTSANPPSMAALLVQKEVAERMAAGPGDMSILAVATQYYAEATLEAVVPAELFTPPPKVDSQIIRLKLRTEPQFPDIDSKLFFRVMKAGFSAKRKKLRSSISAGLGISKSEAEHLLQAAKIDPNDRAETLGLDQWAAIAREYNI